MDVTLAGPESYQEAEMLDADTLSTKPPRPVFGRWLLLQASAAAARRDVKDLSEAARLDRGFPKDGSPEQVAAHLHRAQASPEMHEAFETAEIEWQHY